MVTRSFQINQVKIHQLNTKKDEVAKYSLVEKFVDEDGKELAPNVTKGTDYEAGSAYDVTGDAKVIDGYYLKEAVSDNAKRDIW